MVPQPEMCFYSFKNEKSIKINYQITFFISSKWRFYSDSLDCQSIAPLWKNLASLYRQMALMRKIGMALPLTFKIGQFGRTLYSTIRGIWTGLQKETLRKYRCVQVFALEK